MMVGHTKFAPDWAFGLLTSGIQMSGAFMTKDSATVNNTQLTIGREDKTVFVHHYNWASFFEEIFKRQAF
jgi:hypothetical protein